ncbi:hypothetical protein HPB51_019266 [Rhipicephalus microplus]|uniref:Uncharacterized protein n=1 Tax=Rhipicephalus microplus TaxID=6941 RepID=A0A9J6F7U6_RHIMP|nr:hypothetical protein HPB51_019266 [Rhipicephalus microplus]
MSEVYKMDDVWQQAFVQDTDGGAAELEEYDETGAHGQGISSCPPHSCTTGGGSGRALDRDRPTWLSDNASSTVVVIPPDSQPTRIPGEANHVDGDLPPSGVGDGELGGFRRSCFTGRDVCHDYTMPLPDVEVHTPETAIPFDKEVQCIHKPTFEDKAVQCDIYSSRIAEMMHKEHLLQMEMLLYRNDVLMKKLDKRL